MPSKSPAHRRAHDIGNRINRADFVKVNLLNRRAVYFGFGLGESAKHPVGQFFLASIERAAVDHRRDVMQMAMFVFGLVFDRRLRRPKALLLDLGGHNLHAGQSQGLNAGVDWPARSAPASTSAKVMSPLIPLAQSR